jgi:hypothetical protein
VVARILMIQNPSVTSGTLLNAFFAPSYMIAPSVRESPLAPVRP